MTPATYTFTDAEYLTAKEKERVARQWDLLLRRTFDRPTWDRSKALYKFLTLYCRHIAHYDQAGFYAAQMGSAMKRAGFLSHMLQVLEQQAEHPPPAYADKQDIFAVMLITLNAQWDRLALDARASRLAELEKARAQIDAEIDRLRGGGPDGH